MPSTITQQRKTTNPQIELFVNDSKGTIVDAVLTTIDLLDANITLLIGELEGSKSSAVAGLASQSHVPLVVPVATENGINSIGKIIFSLN